MASQKNFNTSHVTVYRSGGNNDDNTVYISIHLMLLFIKATEILDYAETHFNTSHVTVYRRISQPTRTTGSYFNTSHVTVYQDVLASERLVMLFQYISCYCLSALTSSLQKAHHISIHLMLLFIGNLSSYSSRLSNFNTSHVTVYR